MRWMTGTHSQPEREREEVISDRGAQRGERERERMVEGEEERQGMSAQTCSAEMV